MHLLAVQEVEEVLAVKILPVESEIVWCTYQDFSLPGIFAPGSESSQWEPSLPGTFVPGNFRSGEQRFPGTFIPGANVPGNLIPGIVSSLYDHEGMLALQ